MTLKSLTTTAALAVLACSRVMYAADAQTSLASDASYQPGTPLLSPTMLDDTTTAPAAAPASAPSAPPTPLMGLIANTDFGKFLAAHNLNITGFGEIGYFYDFNNPHLGNGPNGDQPTGILFPGSYSNRFIVDQLDLTLSKALDTTKSWDWGFVFENGYGADYSFFHSHGMLDNRGAFPPAQPQPMNQYDITQAYGQILLPVGSGLTINFGKWVAYFGQEYISPVENQFYTHSYSFSFGIPATNTGVVANYTFAKAFMGNDLNVTGGITRGWNQSTSDNNGAIDGFFEAKSNINDKWSYVFNCEFGPEGSHDNSNYWTTFEAILTYAMSDQLTWNADCTYTDAPHTAVTTPGANAQWGGIALYALYKFNSMFAFNARGEWYRDQGGFTTGTQANYEEISVGLGIHPCPNDNILQFLQVRPEVRQDFSDERVFNTSGGAGDHNQTTAAIDMVMQF